jgi:uncharacterized membrane protein
VVTYSIYAVAALCWLPVVYLQIQMKNILVYCAETNTDIPARYYTLFNLETAVGREKDVHTFVIQLLFLGLTIGLS